MKIKTLLITGIIVLSVFLIYLTTLDKKVYYLALGDSLAAGQTPYGNTDYGYTDYVKDYLKSKGVLETYINQFTEKEYRTTDLKRDIIDNKKIIINDKPQTIKNALIKADLVTLSIGFNDILYKLGINNYNDDNMYDHIDEMMIDMNDLFKLLKEYCKEDIMILGYYLPAIYLNDEETKEYIDYANSKLKNLCDNYDMHYISINNVLQGNNKYIPNPLDIHPSKFGYEAISNEIINKIDKTLFK